MAANHIPEGLLLLLAPVTFFTVKFFRAQKSGRFCAWGWGGLAIILAAELLLSLRVVWVITFFTPLVWTGYLLVVDAMVCRLRGRSLLGESPREFLLLALWSVPLWVVFEGYNLRLQNWVYVNLPSRLVLGELGSVWSFATIWPAMYETADLVRALGVFRDPGRRTFSLGVPGHIGLVLLGAAMVTLPVLLSVRIGQYLFGAVWLGFIFLLDPITYRWNGRSLLRHWERGETATFYSFLLAGLVCGILWEFWNFWAGAKWRYVFPVWQNTKIFEMPLPGYLGFPPFALECFVMYEFVKVFGRTLGRVTAAQVRPQVLVRDRA